MKYAIVTISGKQYKATVGLILEVDKIEGKKGDKVSFTDVLMLADGEKTQIGQPKVAGAKIEASIVDQIKGEKIRVGKFKAKSRYRRVTGFRALKTLLKIDKITP